METAKIEEHVNKRKKRVRSFKLLALFMLLIIIVFGTGMYIYFTREATLHVQIVNVEMLKDEEIPAFSVMVEIEGSKKALANRDDKYTAEDLAKDIENLNEIRLKCDANGKSEGKYPIHLTMNNKLKSQIVDGYIGNVRVEIYDGELYVKNPVGEWEGNKFRKYDGTYVKNEFVLSKENTYYFDDEGNKVTGWENINKNKYYFDKNGVLQTDTWKESNGHTYYLNKQGAALTGWQTIEGSTYYFDREGKMQVGKILLGLAICTFDKDGKLLSKEPTKINPKKPMVALTFDDGPGKRTGDLLKVLKENNAHATFFVLGTNVERYPKLLKRMKKIGCEIGNHSYDHEDMSKLNKKAIKKQVKKTDKLVKKITGSKVALLRPPYGAISDKMKKEVKKPMILWNIDTLDWKTRDAEKTIEAVMKDVKDGDIILMHDIHDATIDAAVELIPMLQEEGFQLVTVSEMAAVKGIILEDGERYTDF